MRFSRPVLLCTAPIFLLVFQLFNSGCHPSTRIRNILPGEIYASAQPDASGLRKAIESLGLRSVLNLRTESLRQEWAREEASVCRESGVSYLALHVPLDDWTPRSTILRLIRILDEAPKPLLIHCRHGVDRSGLAAAVGMLLAGRSLSRAWEEMPAFSRRRALRQERPLAHVLLDYGDALETAGLSSTPEIFRGWAKESYCPLPYDIRISTPDKPSTKATASGFFKIRIQVENRGNTTWKFTEGFALGMRLHPQTQGVSTGYLRAFPEGNFLDLGRSRPESPSLPPGEKRSWVAEFHLPAHKASYVAQIDLVEEGRHWFSEMAWPGVLWKLETEENQPSSGR